jgi:hypothetical protein
VYVKLFARSSIPTPSCFRSFNNDTSFQRPRGTAICRTNTGRCYRFANAHLLVQSGILSSDADTQNHPEGKVPLRASREPGRCRQEDCGAGGTRDQYGCVWPTV